MKKEKISVLEMRNAIEYVCGSRLYDLSDEQLLKLDFRKDMKVGNIRLVNIVVELARRKGISIAFEPLRAVSDDTVGTLLNAINSQIA